jgi:hypothetical protein
LDITYILIANIVVDGLTKLLGRVTFKRFKDQLKIIKIKGYVVSP